MPAGDWYYWKTTFRLDSASVETLRNASLYIRLFDVDVDESGKMPVPKGFLQWQSPVPDGAVIPVVFLTNRVFQTVTDTADLTQLAVKIHRQMEKMMRESRTTAAAVPVWREVQFDCDWTPGTRTAYFHFLQQMHLLFPGHRLSCTVRLHQYRERIRNGVPPVNRGVLMCYNTGDARQRQTTNAVLDLALLKGYLKAPSYPLPLDVALPRFSWGAWFRGDVFQGLLQGWSENRLRDDRLFHPVGDNRYRLRTDTVVDNRYFRRGDEIRLDAVSVSALHNAVALTASVRRADGHLIYFALNE